MAQTGFTPIQLYHSTTAAAAPTAGNLANGELSINITDGKLFYKDNLGVVQVLATKAGANGDVVGPASSTDNALVRFDTTTGKLVQNSAGILDDSGNLTGLAAVTMSGALTLNGGTANGVAYLNGSKVLTTGSGLTFDGSALNFSAASVSVLLNQASADGNGPAIATSKSRGTIASPSAVLSNDSLALFSGGGHNSSALVYNKVAVQMYAAENWTTIANGSYMTFATTPIGTTGRTEKMRITDAGNVGIGTSSPVTSFGQSVHIYNGASTGTVASNSYLLVESLTRNAAIEISGSATSTNSLSFSDTPGTSVAGIASVVADQNILFRTGGVTERMRIDSSGNVGIGRTVAVYRLHVQVDSGATAGVAYPIVAENITTAAGNINGSGFGLRYGSRAAGAVDVIRTNPAGDFGTALVFKNNETGQASGLFADLTERARIDSSGNVGIGTSSPTSSGAGYTVLHVNNATSGGQLHLTGGGSGAAATDGAILTQAGVELFINNQEAGPTLFYNNGSERARIDSSGNLLVGKTTTTIGTSGFVAKADGMTATNANAEAANFNRESSDGGLVLFRRASSQVGSISVTTTTTSYVTSSDYRLKTVIGPVADAGQRIDALQPVEYTWNADGSRTRGFLAHQFQEVYPSSVTGAKDAVDAEGKPIYQQMQAGGSETIADLVAELQSLRARVAALESN
jgi:hypothetical protein